MHNPACYAIIIAGIVFIHTLIIPQGKGPDMWVLPIRRRTFFFGGKPAQAVSSFAWLNRKNATSLPPVKAAPTVHRCAAAALTEQEDLVTKDH